jgi:hypothetical protein
VSSGLSLSNNAAAPATCAADVDVPLIIWTAVSLVNQVDMIATPGAKMSRHGPKFAKLARVSVRSVVLTVIASGMRPGEKPHASELLDPALTT